MGAPPVRPLWAQPEPAGCGRESERHRLSSLSAALGVRQEQTGAGRVPQGCHALCLSVLRVSALRRDDPAAIQASIAAAGVQAMLKENAAQLRDAPGQLPTLLLDHLRGRRDPFAAALLEAVRAMDGTWLEPLSSLRAFRPHQKRINALMLLSADRVRGWQHGGVGGGRTCAGTGGAPRTGQHPAHRWRDDPLCGG